MKRATIRVSGIVQGVGFRYAVRARARSAGVTGYVKNSEDNTVEIVAEGAKTYIESFIRNIHNVGEPVAVDDVKVSYQEATGEFKRFEVITGDLRTELMEGFGAGHLLFERSFQKQDQTIATIQDYSEKMLDKQDQTIATIQDYSEKMLDKQDQTTSEVRSLSNNLGDMMDRRFQGLEGEISLIKEKIGL